MVAARGGGGRRRRRSNGEGEGARGRRIGERERGDDDRANERASERGGDDGVSFSSFSVRLMNEGERERNNNYFFCFECLFLFSLFYILPISDIPFFNFFWSIQAKRKTLEVRFGLI